MTPPDRPSFFPRDTTAYAAMEVGALRALSRSALAMGAVTGVVLRAFRAVVLTHGSGASWWYLGGTYAVGLVVLLGMLALHVANFPVRRWPRHVLFFVLAEWGAEMVASAALIALGREPLGASARATWADWPSLAARALTVRTLMLGAFALVLAGVVQLVRVVLGRRRPARSAG